MTGEHVSAWVAGIGEAPNTVGDDPVVDDDDDELVAEHDVAIPRPDLSPSSWTQLVAGQVVPPALTGDYHRLRTRRKR